MPETLKELLIRYVRADTYSFQDFKELQVDSVGLEGETPLHMACLRGAASDVATLIAGGADVNARTDIGATPLHRAVSGGSLLAVRLLLEARAIPKALALERDFTEIAELLVTYGA
jgi:uncharacterized protein